MISDEPVQDGRMLADRQQAMFLRRNPDSGDCMGMKYARHIGPGAMDRAVEDESGRIDAEARRFVNALPAIGRAWRRDRVCANVEIHVGRGILKKKED